jgi:hypothetical protein
VADSAGVPPAPVVETVAAPLMPASDVAGVLGSVTSPVTADALTGWPMSAAVISLPADSRAIEAASRDHRSGSVSPGAPSAPVGVGGPAGGAALAGPASGGWCAMLVALLACAGVAGLRRHRFSLAVWRPVAFVSLQERPG